MDQHVLLGSDRFNDFDGMSTCLGVRAKKKPRSYTPICRFPIMMLYKNAKVKVRSPDGDSQTCLILLVCCKGTH